jgi:hypothetical protein
MSIYGIIAAVALLLVVVLVLAMPWRRRAVVSLQALNRQRERALAYYERVLTNIRDLDDDYATGKIAQDEYAYERELWAERGVRLLQLFDELDQQHSLTDDENADDAQIDAIIEQALQSLRSDSGGERL